MTSLPIACSLSAGELREREREMRSLFADALQDMRRTPNALDLTFSPGASDRIEALAQAEERCCAFLSFETTASSLTIAAPAGAEDALDGFAALAGETLHP